MDSHAMFKLLRRSFAPAVLIGAAIGVLYMHREPPQVRAEGLERSRALPLEDLELASQGEHVLRGQVLDADGRAAPGVFLSGRVGRRIVAGYTDPLGQFVFDELPGGPLELLLARDVLPHGSAAFELPVDGEQTLRLPPPLDPIETLPEIRRAPLEARLELPFGDLGEGYELAFLPLERGASGATRRDPAPGLDGAVQRRITTGPYGRVRIEDLAEGSYLVAVLPPFARGGTWPQLLEQPIEHLGPSGPLTLRAQSGELRGLLASPDGEPLPRVALHVRSADSPERVWPTSLSQPDGSFRIADLPGGSYRLSLTAGEARFETLVRVSALRTTRVDVPPLDVYVER